MKIKVYEYKNCSTCKKALKFLDSAGISYEKIPIRETPPTISELEFMLKNTNSLKDLFNTSGGDYKNLNLKEKLPKLSEKEALELLSKNGNLVKRPFVVGKTVALVGFKEDIWKQNLT